MIDGCLILILPMVFVGTFKLFCLGVVICCTDFGVELFNNSGDGIGINDSLVIGGDNLWDASEITDGDDGMIYNVNIEYIDTDWYY